MEQKQYDAMQIIMQCSRAYANQMEKCMTNAGLFDKGFHLTVRISPYPKDSRSLCDIEVSEYMTDVGEEQYYKTCMNQYRLKGADWRVRNDPIAEAGTVPENYGSRKETNDRKRVATVSEHHYPVDGFWISNRDDDPILDGGQ